MQSSLADDPVIEELNDYLDQVENGNIENQNFWELIQKVIPSFIEQNETLNEEYQQRQNHFITLGGESSFIQTIEEINTCRLSLISFLDEQKLKDLKSTSKSQNIDYMEKILLEKFRKRLGRLS